MPAADVAARIERLLSDHPPEKTEPADFWAAQFDAGLAWVHFPEGLGGFGADPELQQIVGARLEAAGAPRPEPYNLIGVSLMAPTLVEHGTPQQQQARFLRPAFTCAEIWCQLFSEPGAGSDLASLATRAELDGDTWVVTGQKVWTTMAHRADLALLLARTEPDQPRHRGLSYFILDMHAPGVEVRPLRQITGDAEQGGLPHRRPHPRRRSHRAPGRRLAGRHVDAHERTHRPALRRRQPARRRAHPPSPVGLGAPPGRRPDPVGRDRLAKLWIEAELLRLTMERSEQAERQGRPGPAGSMIKLAFGALGQAVANFCLELAGPAGTMIDHYHLTQPEFFTQTGAAEEADVNPARALLASQALTIAGGTTNINKNILAERVLGLPPEPRLS